MSGKSPTMEHPIPAAALESDIAILGKKGRGKSFTARGIAERLLADGRRVIVLDPLSTWWGLAAGPSGFPIAVLGGPHGDLPLADGDGAALGHHLATAHQSAVLDLGHMRKAEMIRFAAAFLEELYTANRNPLWLVLEEADVFAPQNPDGATARLYGEVDRIARRGRQFGFRLITLTQRPARLAKDVLTQLSTLVALGITSPQDREAIRAWVEGNADRDKAKEVVASLASLHVGEGWVWAPDLDLLKRVTFPPNRTPDTSATPRAGEVRPAAEIGTRANVEAIRAVLAASGAESSATVLAPERQAKPDVAAIQAAEARSYERGRQDGRREALAAVLTEAAAFRTRIDALHGETMEHPAPARAMSATTRRNDAAPPAQNKAPPKRMPDSLPPARQRVLDMLAWFKEVGLDPVERVRVCVMVGLSPKASTFGVYVSELAREGLIETIAPGLLHLTDSGSERAPPPILGDEPDAILRAACGQLKPQPRRLMEIIGTAYPEPVRRDALADALGLSRTASTLGVYLSELSSRGFIEVAGAGQVRAADFLFLRSRGQP